MVGRYRDKLDNRNISLHLNREDSRGGAVHVAPKITAVWRLDPSHVAIRRPASFTLEPSCEATIPFSLPSFISPPHLVLRRRFPIAASIAPAPRRFPIAASTAPAPRRFPIAASTAPAPRRATMAGSWTRCRAPGQSETSSPCSSLGYLLTVMLLVFILGEFFGDYLINLEGGD
jgi:hypothetical protein